MINNSIRFVLASILLLAASCQQQESNKWRNPQGINEYAKIANGRGNAENWGILFDVEEPGAGGVSSSVAFNIGQTVTKEH